MRRLTTPAWLLKHALAVVLVVAFLWLGWWQIGRAAGGNALSYGYSIEWPFFAAFVVFMWVREARLTLRGPAPAAEPRPAEASAAPAGTPIKGFDVDAAIAHRTAANAAALDADAASADLEGAGAYNQYLAWLAENPDVRPGDLRRAARATTKE